MATEILRPNGTGDGTAIASQYPDGTFHWDKVDEVTPDEASTRVYTTSVSYQRDLYRLPPSSGSGPINFIKIYFRVHCLFTGYAKPALKSNSTVTNGTEVEAPDGYTTYSEQWNTNPANGLPWERADIDSLQIGISLKQGNNAVACTQVYVEVDYNPTAYQNVGQGILTIVQSLTLPSLSKVVGQGVLAIVGAVDLRKIVFGLVGQGRVRMAGGLSLAKSFNRIVGQGAMAIIGMPSTIKRIHWLVGQSTLRIKGTFKTTLDRILKILSLTTAKYLNIICAPIGGSNMPDFFAGETVICSIKIQDEGEEPKDPTKGAKITITNPQGNTMVDEGDMTRDELGEYHYDYNSSPMDSAGAYEVKYTTIDGTRITMAEASFTIQ